MATILREPGPVYGVRYDRVPLEQVAASERNFPADWITKDGFDVTDEFVRYARPLVGEDMVSLPLDRRPAAAGANAADLRPADAAKICSAGGSNVNLHEPIEAFEERPISNEMCRVFLGPSVPPYKSFLPLAKFLKLAFNGRKSSA